MSKASIQGLRLISNIHLWQPSLRISPFGWATNHAKNALSEFSSNHSLSSNLSVEPDYVLPSTSCSLIVFALCATRKIHIESLRAKSVSAFSCIPTNNFPHLYVNCLDRSNRYPYWQPRWKGAIRMDWHARNPASFRCRFFQGLRVPRNKRTLQPLKMVAQPQSGREGFQSWQGCKATTVCPLGSSDR